MPTLEQISQKKQELLQQIRTQQEQIQRITNELFAPPQASNKMELLFNSVRSGIAMYEGVMTGIRLMRRIRRMFNKKK